MKNGELRLEDQKQFGHRFIPSLCLQPLFESAGETLHFETQCEEARDDQVRESSDDDSFSSFPAHLFSRFTLLRRRLLRLRLLRLAVQLDAQLARLPVGADG